MQGEEKPLGPKLGNFFSGNHRALNGQPLGGPISLKMTFTDTCVSSKIVKVVIHLKVSSI